MGWIYLSVLLGVCLVLSSVGFYKYVYFISIGYGFSVAGIGVTLTVMSFMGVFNAGVVHYILFLLLIVYGVRLSGFLLKREIKNKSYQKTLKEISKDGKEVPIFAKLGIWFSVCALYVAQTSPVFFRMLNGGKTTASMYIGMAICIIALIIESVADRQKSVQKAKRPDMVATKGLYKIVRCPNYFGEILFWTGILISGFDIYNIVGQWLMAVIGYICIVYIMFNGAHRLEKRQMKRYGNNEEYNEYANKTPIIIPFVPIYHLNKK